MTHDAEHKKELYRLLREVDSELQYLGVRGDWGWSDDPSFIAKTVVCCLCFIAREPGVPANFLSDAARELLGVQIQRARQDSSAVCSRLPDVDTYNSFLMRAKDYTVNVLVPGGLCASNGNTVTAKLKKCLLLMARADDLRQISVVQWETIFAALDAAAKNGNEAAVGFVTNVLVSELQTVSS